MSQTVTADRAAREPGGGATQGRTERGRKADPSEPSGPGGRSDPFVCTAEDLAQLAAESVVAEGVALVASDSVTMLGTETHLADEGGATSPPALAMTLLGTVDAGDNVCHEVEVVAEPGGALRCVCPCDWPWPGFCSHGVAILVAWQRRQADIGRGSAREEAVAAREGRGRSEVRTRPLSGVVGFGSWAARTLRQGGSGHVWRVELASLTQRVNSCTCPDFAGNELGTCKHIEAVKTRVAGQAPAAPARAVVWLDWSGEPRPALHLQGAVPPLVRALVRPLRKPGMPLALAARVASLAERRVPELLVTAAAQRWAQATLTGAAAATRRAAVAATVRLYGPEQPGMKTRLHPYQVEGAAFLAGKGRALLADDMGLGKTVQAIAAMRALMDAGEVQRALVVCPASLKHQWAAEIQRHSGLRVAVVDGGPQERWAQYDAQAPVTVVNYELVLREAAQLQERLQPDLLVLDEAQRIRNWKTKTATAVKTLRAPFAFVLTGTPLENRAADLYSLLQVVDPTVLGPLWRFLADHVVSDRFGRVIAHRDLAGLRRKLRRVMLRRTREVVADQLPDRELALHQVVLDDKQTALHDSGVAAMRAITELAKQEKRPLTPSERNRLMSAIQQTRMACNAAGLIDKVTLTSPKLDALRELVAQLWLGEGRKVVVFSQFERMTALAEATLREDGVGCVRLHGGVPTRRRGRLIRRFETDPTVGVFFSTDAGATGLNLQAASALVHLELPFNPAVLAQRNGRIHRLGQERACLCVAVVAADSYESRVLANLGRKQALFDAVVAGEGADAADAVGAELKRLSESMAQDDALTPSPTRLGGDVAPPELVAGASLDSTGDANEATPAATAAGDDPTLDLPEPEPAPVGAAPKTVAAVVARVQAVAGARLQRMEVVGTGLVALVDRADEALRASVDRALAELRATDAELDVPVAVVDSGSWRALLALGLRPEAALAGGSTRSSDEPAETPLAAPAAPPAPAPGAALRARAAHKLRAAEALVAAQCGEEALRLMAEALVATMAAKLGRDTAPALSVAMAFAFGEVLAHDADLGGAVNLLARLVGLRAAAGLTLSTAALEGLLAEVEPLVG